MRIPEALAITFGIAVVVNFLLTAFGGLEPSPLRRAFDRAVTAGLRLVIVYLAAALLFVTFQGLSSERAVRSTLANMFAVALAPLVAILFVSDLFTSSKPSKKE